MTERRTTWSADELLATTFPDPRWAVPGLIAEGLSLLVGPPKVGKSWLVLSLAIAVASGGQALDRIDVDSGEVLYLALEDPPRRLQKRLRSLLRGAEPPSRLILHTEWRGLNDGGAVMLDEYLQNYPATRLVVVDVFAKIRGRVSDDGNRYDADYGAMGQLKDVADKHSVAVIVVHHTRKARSDDFLDTVSGTHGIAGAADGVLVLQRARNSTEAKLAVTGRDVEENAYAMTLDSHTGAWSLLDAPASDISLSPERRRIRDLLRAEPDIGPTLIAERLGITVDNAKQTVRRMLDADQLHTDGAGHYSVPGPSPYLSPLSPQSLVTEQIPPAGDSGDSSDTPTAATAATCEHEPNPWNPCGCAETTLDADELLAAFPGSRAAS